MNIELTEARINKMTFIIQTLGSAMKSFEDPNVAISYVINVLADMAERDDDYMSILFGIPTMLNELEHSAPQFHNLAHLLLISPVAESSGIIHDIDAYINSANNKCFSKLKLTLEEEITVAMLHFIKAMDKLMNITETKREGVNG